MVAPCSLQPSRKSHVPGRYTHSGSYVGGHRHKHAWSPYSVQSGNIAALENQSIRQPRVVALRSSPCLRQFDSTYLSACRACVGDVMISA